MNFPSLSLPEWTVLAVGFAGQALFSARFLVQWIASERIGRSTIPVAFWYLSLAGGGVLFAYAAYREDPVFVVGQGFGIFIYLRNLWLIHHPERAGITRKRSEPQP